MADSLLCCLALPISISALLYFISHKSAKFMVGHATDAALIANHRELEIEEKKAC
jgi:hypothetical protein